MQHVQSCDQTVGERHPQRADRFVAPGIDSDSFTAANRATATTQPSEKFHVFHQWHLREPADGEEIAASTKHPVIATAHPQHQPGVMRKLIRQPVNERRPRQPDAKKTAGDAWIGETRSDVIEAAWRYFEIDM